MPKFKMKYEILTDYLTVGTKKRSGKLIPKVLFIVAHDTGNDGSTAKGNINYYKRVQNLEYPSAHTFIDDKYIIECIPATTGKPEKANHVLYEKPTDNKLFGDDANDSAIGVELCYSHKRGNINNEEAYKRYVWYIAYCCFKFNLDPSKKVVSHKILDPERKLDPDNALSKMGKTYQQLLKDIVNEYNSCLIKDESVPTKPPTQNTKKEETKVEDKVIKLKMDKKQYEDGAKAIDELHSAGLLNSPDVWKQKLDEPMPVWAFMIMFNRLAKLAKGER